MTEKKTKSIELVLTNDWPNGRITVDMEAFFDFSFWLAEELEDLVSQWRHRAGPRSRVADRRSLRRES